MVSIAQHTGIAMANKKKDSADGGILLSAAIPVAQDWGPRPRANNLGLGVAMAKMPMEEDDADGGIPPVAQISKADLANSERDAIAGPKSVFDEDFKSGGTEYVPGKASLSHQASKKYGPGMRLSLLRSAAEGVPIEEDDPEHNHSPAYNWFTRIVTFFIMLNSIQLGACVGQDDNAVCSGCEVFFAVIFTVEMIVKLYVHRMEYFKELWNWMDFFLVAIALFDIVAQFGFSGCEHCNSLEVFRLARILRALRLFRILRSRRELVVLAEGLSQSLKSMGWVCLLLGVMIYASSIFAVSAFGSQTEAIGWEVAYFETLPRAAFTLFNMSILDEWSDILRPLIEVQPLYISFFIFYVFICAFGILNLIIGIIAESTTKAGQDFEEVNIARERRRKMECLIDAADAFFTECDDSKDGKLSWSEFCIHDKGQAFDLLMQEVNLPLGFGPADLHLLVSPNKEITRDDFVLAMTRIVFCDQFGRDCLNQYSVNDLRRSHNAFVCIADKQADDNFQLQQDLAKLTAEIHQEFNRLHAKVSGPASMDGSLSKEPAVFCVAEPTEKDNFMSHLEVTKAQLAEFHHQMQEMREQLMSPLAMGNKSEQLGRHIDPDELVADSTMPSGLPATGSQVDFFNALRIDDLGVASMDPAMQTALEDHPFKDAAVLHRAAGIGGTKTGTRKLYASKGTPQTSPAQPQTSPSPPQLSVPVYVPDECSTPVADVDVDLADRTAHAERTPMAGAAPICGGFNVPL